MDVLKDLKYQLKKNHKYTQFKSYLEKLENMDASRTWVPMPGAFGDTYKYTSEFSLNDYHFAYSHILPENGTPFNYQLVISKDKKSETIFDTNSRLNADTFITLITFLQTLPLFSKFIMDMGGSIFIDSLVAHEHNHEKICKFWDLLYFVSICMSFMINDVVTFIPDETVERITIRSLSLHQFLKIHKNGQ